jgi:large conductance mechanosensitive channel
VTSYDREATRREEGVVGKEFREFLLRGNVVDLAVGIVIGVAFGAVITSFVAAFLTPLIALIAAAAVFFLVIRPVNALMARRRTEPDVASTTRGCPECLSSIPAAARRCAFCTAEVGAAA